MDKLTDQELQEAFAKIPRERVAELRAIAENVDRAMGEIHSRSRSDEAYMAAFIDDPIRMLEETDVGLLTLPEDDRPYFAQSLRDWVQEIDDPNKLSCRQCRVTIIVVVYSVLVFAVVVVAGLAPEIALAIEALAWFDFIATAAFIAATIGKTAVQASEMYCKANGNCP